jgi:putative membrane protein
VADTGSVRGRAAAGETDMKCTTSLCVTLLALAFGATAALAQGAGPTDAQIAAIVVTANQVDIDAGKLAKSKAQSPEVKEFAQRMITDHGAVNKSATELVQKLHVTPEPSATSASLKQGGDENLAKLKTLSGAAFDKAYIDHEVAYHEAVLSALDKTLIPDAQNAELKALLVKVRPAFEAHLDMAKELQAKLGKSGA